MNLPCRHRQPNVAPPAGSWKSSVRRHVSSGENGEHRTPASGYSGAGLRGKPKRRNWANMRAHVLRWVDQRGFETEIVELSAR